MKSRVSLIANSLRDSLVRYFDREKKSIECEFGYIENPTFHDLYKYYRRNGLAGGAIVKSNNKVWSDYPEIYRGSKSEEDQVYDEYEKKVNAILNDNLWREFKEADKRRMIGRWSALILYFNDAHEVAMSDAVSEGRTLRFVKSAWANSLTVLTYDDAGIPVLWEYQPPKIDGIVQQSVTIHRDRVFILGDMTEDGEAFHERGLNNIMNTDKVEGGSAESYRKNAANMIHINFSADADEIETGGEDDGGLKDVRKDMNKIGRDLNQGKDTILVTQGANSSQLVSPVADPTPTFMCNVQTFCASLPISISAKILLGNQTGERASTEDIKQFHSSCQDYRIWQLTPEIIKFLHKLMNLRVIEYQEVGVTWSDLTIPTQLEMLEIAEKMSEINTKQMMLGNDSIFTEEEIRSVAGYDTSTDNSEI